MKKAGISHLKDKNTKKRDATLLTTKYWLREARVRSEKCELQEASEAYTTALEQARGNRDIPTIMESIAGLLRLASEARDEKSVDRLENELEKLMKKFPRKIPAMAWYCKGAIARHRDQPLLAQKYFHRYLNIIRKSSQPVSAAMSQDEATARGWLMLAGCLRQRGRLRRTRLLAETLLKIYGSRFATVSGSLYLLVGLVDEHGNQFDSAMQWFQRAHIAFMEEHHWYYHLYVLYAYARIHRLQKNFTQASWYLDLLETATSKPEFGYLRSQIQNERKCLEKNAVDLAIDTRRGLIRTRDGNAISVRKQYVLLNILEELCNAHAESIEDQERGLSKAEIIEKVWKERYRPEAHDNKLYYNINRLRKLIEPDVRNPSYVLNWKEGYRLAPGLRVQFIQGEKRILSVGDHSKEREE